MENMEKQMIGEVELYRLRENPENPREISEEKFGLLVKSVLVFPRMLWLAPIVYDEAGVVLGGNMRLRALNAIAEMSDTEREDIIKTDGRLNGEKVVALVTYWQAWASEKAPRVPAVCADDLTEEQKKEFIIKHNASFGKWDFDKLANEWSGLPLNDWAIDVWEPMEIGADNKDSDKSSVFIEDDNFEEKLTIKKRCSYGDVWKLGEHRLMCGDSSNTQCVERLMQGEKADMVFTDPPYGVAIGDKNKALKDITGGGGICENIKNDNIPIEQLKDLLVNAMTNCRLNCKENACYFVTSPQGGELGMMMMMMMKEAGLPVRHILIWEKNSATFSMGRLDYDYQHEPIFYTWTKKHHNYRNGEFRTTIWKYNKPLKNDLHPTMKPVGLVANCMNDCTLEGDIVLDLFGGSGTTIIAAEKLNRKARLMEIDPHYCDVIITRWEEYTGKEAVKIM